MSRKNIERLGGIDKAKSTLLALKKYAKDHSIRKKVIRLELDILNHELYLTKESNRVLLDGLKEIKDPIKYMIKRLAPDERLEGIYAISIGKDSNYLKSIAENSLKKSKLVYTN